MFRPTAIPGNGQGVHKRGSRGQHFARFGRQQMHAAEASGDRAAAQRNAHDLRLQRPCETRR